jgi:hypothetical protein
VLQAMQCRRRQLAAQVAARAAAASTELRGHKLVAVVVAGGLAQPAAAARWLQLLQAWLGLQRVTVAAPGVALLVVRLRERGQAPVAGDATAAGAAAHAAAAANALELRRLGQLRAASAVCRRLLASAAAWSAQGLLLLLLSAGHA